MTRSKRQKFFWERLGLFLASTSVFLALGFGLFLLAISLFAPQEVKLSNLTGEYDSSARVAIFHNQKVMVGLPLASLNPSPSVLGESSGNKRIEVDLTNQRLYAYEGDRMVYNFQVSTGKWGRTPTGTFNIWIKLRYTRMTGGSTALGTYYDLPNVPYTMFFYSSEVPKWKGYSLHGTYWHNNFGHPMSHGCVNMRTEEVAQLYYWAMPDLQGKQSILATTDNPGTPVVIYGQAPLE